LGSGFGIDAVFGKSAGGIKDWKEALAELIRTLKKYRFA